MCKYIGTEFNVMVSDYCVFISRDNSHESVFRLPHCLLFPLLVHSQVSWGEVWICSEPCIPRRPIGSMGWPGPFARKSIEYQGDWNRHVYSMSSRVNGKESHLLE